ncbi:hypothetical protein [Nitrosopumilus zosterae]|uniref:hypothetical protein n=1 Tax=Nitrosopumilus zosterae TaxID=718286 RepID=UPI001CEC599C|nr:hypothetical protein [Nitrosopumilus zosterae]
MNVYFLVILTLSCILILNVGTSYADVIPPRHQQKIGMSSDDVVCDSGLFKVIRERTNSVACVEPENVTKLVGMGWAKKVDDKQLSDMINRKSIQVGTINILEKIPVRTNVGKLASSTSISGYDIVFEVCASTSIYAPDVLVRSDSESKRYEMIETITANSCVLSVSKIKAADANSITVTLLNKGDISQKVLSLQNELDSLKQQLLDAKQSFKNPQASDAQIQGTKIADLRKQVNDKREELHRLLFTLHSPQTDKQKLEKFTFSGNVIEGESASILSVIESVQTPGLFDAIFEVCAGDTTVRLPVVTITSDKQTIKIKLGDKVSANSCQMTSGKIEADDKSSINITPAGNASSSNKVTELEMLIGSLTGQMVKEKQVLKDLVHDSNRASNFTELFDAQVSKIVELRNQITNAKAEFSKILYLTYN